MPEMTDIIYFFNRSVKYIITHVSWNMCDSLEYLYEQYKINIFI